MKPETPDSKTGSALGAAPLLGHRSLHDIWRLWWDADIDLWRAFRLLRIKCFFGFCEFAVTHRGGVYLLQAAMIPVHLCEHFKDFGCFHDRFCVVCRVWWPNESKLSDSQPGRKP